MKELTWESLSATFVRNILAIPSWVGYNENLEFVAIGKSAAHSHNLFYDVKRIIGNTKAGV